MSTDQLKTFESFSFLEALTGRRSRRFGFGMEVPSGPLAYRSQEAPLPLSDLERNLVVFCAAGATGYNTGMEHTAASSKDELCSYPVRFTGRSAPSGAGVGASELLIVNDDGLYITQLRNRESVDDLVNKQSLPEAAQQLWDGSVVQLSDERLKMPREAPHYSPHNFWNANVEGATVLIPIVDLTELLLDFLLVYLGTGAVPVDSYTGEVIGNLDEEAASGAVDLTKQFPYQDFEQYIVACGAAETSIMSHNAVLALQGIGLGGWMFTGMDPTSLLGGRPEVEGAGFSFVTRESTGLPVCIGLEKYFESYVQEWHGSSVAAVDAFLDRKYGVEGTYSGKYKTRWKSPSTIHQAKRPKPEIESALRKIVTAVVERYGTFPATSPAVFTRFYTQVHHVDIDFYEKFYDPPMLLNTHYQHHQQWH